MNSCKLVFKISALLFFFFFASCDDNPTEIVNTEPDPIEQPDTPKVLVDLSTISWERIDGPRGGAIDNIYQAENGKIYAISYQDLLVSSDNGNSWTKRALDNGEPYGLHYYRTEFIVSGNVIFLPTYSGVYVSANDGVSWEKIDELVSGSSFKLLRNNVIVASQRMIGPNAVLIGFAYSTDNGETWIQSDALFEGEGGKHILSASSGKLFTYVGKNVVVSADEGKNWEIAGSFESTYDYAWAIAESDNSLFIFTGSEVFKSDDEGLSWEKMSFTVPSRPKDIFVENDNSTKLLTGDGIYNLSESGFEKVNSLSIPKPDQILYSADNSILIGTHGNGFYRSTDGNSWTQVNNGLPYSGVETVEFKDNVIYASFISMGSNGAGVYKADLTGFNWERTNIDTGLIRDIEIDNEGNVFAGGSTGIFYSTGGNTFTKAFSAVACTSGVNSILAAANNRILVGKGDGLYYSDDQGGSWNSCGFEDYDVWEITKDTNNVLYAYASPDYGTCSMIKSSDNGLSWESIRSYNYMVDILVVTEGNHFYTNGWDKEKADWIFEYSADNGQNWENIPYSLNRRGIASSLCINDSTIIVGTWDDIWYADSYGRNWSLISNGILQDAQSQNTLKYVNDIKLGPDLCLYAATKYGLYKTIDPIYQ